MQSTYHSWTNISLTFICTALDLKAETENEFYMRDAKDMVNIVHKLISEGELGF